MGCYFDLIDSRGLLTIKVKYVGYLLLFPALFTLVLLIIVPFVYSLYLSLCRWDITVFNRPEFIGITNYLDIILSHDFFSSLITTLFFCAVALSIELVLGLALALELNKEFRVKGIVQTLVMLPMVLTSVVSASSWRILLDPTFGEINAFLKAIGLLPVSFLGNPDTALISIVLIDVWQWTPFLALIILAGLQSLPMEPFEAAEIDGASALQKLRYVTLPLLKPVITVGILFRLFSLMTVFDVILITTRGGPGSATTTLNIYTFLQSFDYFHLGYGAALAVILTFGTVAISQVIVKYSRVKPAGE